VNWAKWDAEHGHGGTGVSSADKIAAQIRGALGAGKTDEPKVRTVRGRSGSTISRAESARSAVSHVQKSDMKRPAPVKGEKDQADSFRTKIRMAEYNRKKAAAVSQDPVDKHTPRTEARSNPASDSSKKIADQIRGVHGAQHGKDVPAPAKKTARAPKTVKTEAEPTLYKDDEYGRASKAADEATRKAEADPTDENHKAAMAAHSYAAGKLGSGKVSSKNPGAVTYHNAMRTYHYYANHPNRPKAGVVEEHGDRVDPNAAAGQFLDTRSRAASEAAYNSIPEVRKTGVGPEHLDSVRAYTKGSDATINSHLRSGPSSDPSVAAQAQGHIDRLDEAFAKQAPLSSDLTSYRGVSHVEQLFGKVGERVGSEFVDHGFSSTTTNPEIARSFGAQHQGGALLRVTTKAGTRVLNPAGAGGFGRSEREIMMPRGSSYRVKADRMVRLHDGTLQRQIDLEHGG